MAPGHHVEHHRCPLPLVPACVGGGVRAGLPAVVLVEVSQVRQPGRPRRQIIKTRRRILPDLTAGAGPA